MFVFSYCLFDLQDMYACHKLTMVVETNDELAKYSKIIWHIYIYMYYIYIYIYICIPIKHIMDRLFTDMSKESCQELWQFSSVLLLWHVCQKSVFRYSWRVYICYIKITLLHWHRSYKRGFNCQNVFHNNIPIGSQGL